MLKIKKEFLADMYNKLNKKMKSLLSENDHLVTNLSNASALIWEELKDINWAGFYIAEGDRLYLGPFQGKPACVTIPMGKGVCGTAAKEGATVDVENVHEFAGHIACDCASNSEIVVPLFARGQVVGVLDIDSPIFGRFTATDKEGLEETGRIISQIWENCNN